MALPDISLVFYIFTSEETFYRRPWGHDYIFHDDDEMLTTSGANSQIFWEGKIFYGIGENFFCAVMPKAPYQHPYWSQFMY